MQYKYKNLRHFFTLKSPALAGALVMDIEFAQIDSPNKRFKTKGIWDTGASKSVITKEVMDQLDLKPFGRAIVSTATESNVSKETYLVHLFLKQDLQIQALEVTVGKVAAEHGINALIGMDIITLGDFSITNIDGQTWYLFLSFISSYYPILSRDFLYVYILSAGDEI